MRKFTARTAEGIRERSPGSFEIRYEGPRDRAGRRKALSLTFRCDTLDGALRERRRLQAEVDAGRHIDRTKLTVAEHVQKRIAQWAALDTITPKTAMRYRELAANQIAVHRRLRATEAQDDRYRRMARRVARVRP